MALSYRSEEPITKHIHAEEFLPNELQYMIFVDLQPEGEQSGLAAESTGVKFDSGFRLKVDDVMKRFLKAAYLEAAKSSSHGDEVTAVELYDDDEGALATSFDITGSSSRTRSSDISDNLTIGHEYHIRWNVTTASATSGATFDAIGVRLLLVYGIS